jgi:hypothetical protein
MYDIHYTHGLVVFADDRRYRDARMYFDVQNFEGRRFVIIICGARARPFAEYFTGNKHFLHLALDNQLKAMGIRNNEILRSHIVGRKHNLNATLHCTNGTERQVTIHTAVALKLIHSTRMTASKSALRLLDDRAPFLTRITVRSHKK